MKISFDILTESKTGLLSNFRIKCFGKKLYLLSKRDDSSLSGLDDLDCISLNYGGFYQCQQKCKLCQSDDMERLICACRITYMEDIPDAILGNNVINRPFVLLSRVCVDESNRNKDTYILMFLNLSKWLLNNTFYTEYIAYCTEEQCRLYKKLGAIKLSSQPLFVYDNQPQPYFMVTGNILEFYNYSKSYYETIQKVSI